MLEGLLDDELAASRVARVLEHLEECPDCLGELAELVCLQRSLARLAPTR
jgi:anti-sigma factor RsiW